MSTSNPSHLLLNRHPRSPAHPLVQTQTLYAPSPTPTPTPGPAAHLFSYTSPPSDHHAHARSHSTPTLFPDGLGHGGPGPGSGTGTMAGTASSDTDDDEVTVHPTFWRDATLPGRVKVVVGRHEFWCHKEVLWFASPFFSACLQGSWAETELAEPRFRAASPDDRGRDWRDDGRPDSMQLDADGTGGAGRYSFEARGLASPRTPRSPLSPCSPRSPHGDTDPDASEEGKTSVYLDAVDHNVADLMRELRELPDPPGRPGNALETLVEGESLRRVGVEGEGAGLGDGEGRGTGKEGEGGAGHGHGGRQGGPSPRPKMEVSDSRSRSEAVSGATSPTTPHRLDHITARHAKRTSASSLNLARRRTHSAGRERRRHERHDALIELPEDSPAAFQDFLFWAYPHLECKVTWTNVARVLALSSKIIVPALQTLCERFLLTHASGRPIEALALAEKHENSELYREASRFVLDQASWDPDEFDSLSEQTQLKLSRRRMWFLERLLKLGTIDVKKEYVCRPDCPDQSRCQAQLDDKWRQAHTAVSRYGPPQPSVAFRCLRQLEGFPTNPALIMQHPLCQSSAKSWVASLFDRMFSLKAISARTPGTEKYWMFITMN